MNYNNYTLNSEKRDHEYDEQQEKVQRQREIVHDWSVRINNKWVPFWLVVLVTIFVVYLIYTLTKSTRVKTIMFSLPDSLVQSLERIGLGSSRKSNVSDSAMSALVRTDNNARDAREQLNRLFSSW